MVKLILTDMDGTLLDDHKQLPDDIFEQIEKLSKQGIYFGIASGRQYPYLERCFEKVKDKVIFIAQNGSYIRIKDEIIYLCPLPKEEVKKWVAECQDIPDTKPILSGAEAGYCFTSEDRFIKCFDEYYACYVNDENYLDLMMKDEILSISICDLKDVETNTYEKYKKYLPDYQVKIAGDIWMDINRKEVNKGTAVQKIQEYFGISYDETMVFGDYMNDYEMMDHAYFSVAMENAYPKLKEVCRYMTCSNNERGVSKVIDACLKGNLEQALIKLK